MGELEYIIGHRLKKGGKRYYSCIVVKDYDRAMDMIAEWESRGWQTIIRGRKHGVIFTL